MSPLWLLFVPWAVVSASLYKSYDMDDADIKNILELTNGYRSKVALGKMAPKLPKASQMQVLDYSEDIEEYTRRYAQACNSSVHNTGSSMLNIVTMTDIFGGNGEDRTLTTSKKKAAISFALKQWFNERKFFTWPNKCNPTCCSFKSMMYDKAETVGCSITQCDNFMENDPPIPRAIQIVCAFDPTTFSSQPYQGGDLDCPHDYPIRRKDGLCAEE